MRPLLSKKAMERANEIFPPLPHAGKENVYLSRKGVLPLGNLRTCAAAATPYPDLFTGEVLVVPIFNTAGALVSLQFIGRAVDSEGIEKRFLAGGKKKACFFPIPARDNDKTGPLLIGEGVATVLSACMATGFAGLVAFDAGNLLSVAEVARNRYPEREIILCADNDCQTARADGTLWNPGVEAATEAALAVGGKLSVCPAHEGRKRPLASCFNDMYLLINF